MSEEVYKGMYYKLTEEDKEQIVNCFNDHNLKELIELCEAIAVVASNYGWKNAELYLKEVGEEKFFRDCSNCGFMFDCTPLFAINECGDRYKKWIPMTKKHDKRLEELQKFLLKSRSI